MDFLTKAGLLSQCVPLKNMRLFYSFLICVSPIQPTQITKFTPKTMREIPKNIEFCCKITHNTNTVHERQVFGVGGSCQRCTELSLASTAVALTLFYGLKSTLLFGPFSQLVL